MSKYIELYKLEQPFIAGPWLKHLILQDKQKLAEISDKLTWQEIIQYREWALIEIKIEAKRHVTSSKSEYQEKELGEIWSNCINEENLRHTNGAMNEGDDTKETELSRSEKIDLYEILAQDNSFVLDQFLKGRFTEPDVITMKFSLSIRCLYLFITEVTLNKTDTIVSIELTKFKKDCTCVQCQELRADPNYCKEYLGDNDIDQEENGMSDIMGISGYSAECKVKRQIEILRDEKPSLALEKQIENLKNDELFEKLPDLNHGKAQKDVKKPGEHRGQRSKKNKTIGVDNMRLISIVEV
jgi:hypothetical protein